MTVVATLLGVTPSARAGAAAKLTYVRGPGAERCPDEAALRRLVAERVGYDLFFSWPRKTVVVEVTASEAHGYGGLIQIVDEHGVMIGERHLATRSDDCKDLVGALALAISIAVDDRTLDEVPAPKKEQSVTPGPATLPAMELDDLPPPRPVAAGPGDERASAWTWSAQLTPQVAFNIAPSVAFGASAGVAARYRLASMGLELRADLPASGDAPDGARVSTWLALALAVPCLHPVPALLVCALGGAGVFSESGHDLASPRTQSAPFLTAGGRIGLEVPLVGSLFFVANADVLAALTRPEVTVDNISAFHVPSVSLTTGVGVGVDL